MKPILSCILSIFIVNLSNAAFPNPSSIEIVSIIHSPPFNVNIEYLLFLLKSVITIPSYLSVFTLNLLKYDSTNGSKDFSILAVFLNNSVFSS